MKVLGIRKECKNKWERRVPLNPAAVGELIKDGFKVVIQPSKRRIYPDEMYRRAGAEVSMDLSKCNFILGVKEVPIRDISRGVPHMFFSHTVKGQKYNMPLLQAFLDSGTTLIDYEKVVNRKGQRLIFFGEYAGKAGTLETLRGYGIRLKEQFGIQTPFTKLHPAYEYQCYEDAYNHLKEIGKEIAREGLPEEISPLNVFILGYGNVSKGCQHVMSALPLRKIEPRQLEHQQPDRHAVYQVVFMEEHLVKRKNDGKFDLLDYFAHGSEYQSRMSEYIRFCSIYINAIYWSAGYPVFLSNSDLESFLNRNHQKLVIVGDISCDINGSVEATVKATSPDSPVYIYNAETRTVVDGFKGEGVAVCSVDNLPCEFSKEASDNFTKALKPFIKDILKGDFSKNISDSNLPDEIKGATIAHLGRLEPKYAYLYDHLNK